VKVTVVSYVQSHYKFREFFPKRIIRIMRMEQVYGESRVTAKILKYKFNVIYSAVLHFSYIIKEPQDFWSHGHPLESRYGPN